MPWGSPSSPIKTHRRGIGVSGQCPCWQYFVAILDMVTPGPVKCPLLETLGTRIAIYRPCPKCKFMSEWNACCYFKPLTFGMVCYAATDNQNKAQVAGVTALSHCFFLSSALVLSGPHCHPGHSPVSMSVKLERLVHCLARRLLNWMSWVKVTNPNNYENPWSPRVKHIDSWSSFQPYIELDSLGPRPRHF